MLPGPGRMRVCAGALVGAFLACAVPAAAPATTPAKPCRPSWQVFAHGARVPPLDAVAALSDRDVWAVGGVSGGLTGPTRSQAVVVHWDGHSLSTMRLPWQRAELSDVAAVAPNDLWAVGSIDEHVLAAHWDGRRWRQVRVWPWSHAWLRSISALGPNDIWAGGGFRKRPLVAHWDGRAWQVSLLWGAAPNFADVRAIAAVSSTVIWASGEDGLDAPSTMGFGDLEVRRDGHAWRLVGHVSHSMYDNVADATGVAPDGELWELSSDYSGNGVDVTRWNSRTGKELANLLWEPDSLPSLSAIAPLSRRDAWAVGEVEPAWAKHLAVFPVVAHWDGHAWHRVGTPFDRFDGTGLNDIAALGPNDLWAVGDHLIVHGACR